MVKYAYCAPIAQWIEQDGSNVKVGGSNPSGRTNNLGGELLFARTSNIMFTGFLVLPFRMEYFEKHFFLLTYLGTTVRSTQDETVLLCFLLREDKIKEGAV